ncbi:MAG: alpha/beta hydrolase [Chthoniobacterales bacterium]
MLLAVAIASVLVWRSVRQHQANSARKIAVPPGVYSLEQVRLGGVAQWILIRGHDTSLPVILFLHGGPGVPEMPFEYVNALLEQHFIVVEWDQRGAGKSFDAKIAPESMRFDQLVSDARELVELLRARFGQAQIFLAAHSSGTVVGARLVAAAPQLFRAYVGISQVADMQQSEMFLYNLALRAAQTSSNREAQEELREIGPPPFADRRELQISQKWVNHFQPDALGAISSQRAKLMFLSPDSTLFDFVRLVRGVKFSFEHLWRELFAVDLFKELPRLEVPVYFVEGRHDRVVTGEVAAKYFDGLDAPRGKQLIWFENSGHWPQLDEPAKFQDTLVNRVLRDSSFRQ